MNILEVYVISSVRPEPTSAGQVILHRHLTDITGLEYESYGSEPGGITSSSAIRRIVGRVSQTRFQKFANDFWAWRDGRWLDALLPTSIPEPNSSLVLTVAQGDACGAAQRFALKHRLPLVTIFHDWWPDMVSLHTPFRRILEQRFRDLYRESQIAFCVSEGMRMELGSHPNAQVLYPISRKSNSLPISFKKESKFKLIYFGNLCAYGPMLEGALDVMKDHPRVRIEVRGANPNWSESFRCEMKRLGLWHDFAPVSILKSWAESADAYLITMVFDPTMRRRMETSFPSKMVEMAQLGKPLVVWGPEYCSAVQWARRGDRALCVTDPDPKVLRQELEKLAASPEEFHRLSSAARDAASSDFSPEKIQAQFLNALRDTLTMV